MKRRVVFVGLIAGLTTFVGVTAAAVAGPDGSANATMCVLNTRLLAENEVTNTGAPASTSLASGHTQVKVRNDGTIEFKTFILNPGGTEVFTQAHIHGQAPAGANTGIRVDFFLPSDPVSPLTGTTITFTGEGRVRAGNPTIATLLCQSPELYYVNYHSVAFPGGAIRGQLG